jgi:hypothetical protein
MSLLIPLLQVQRDQHVSRPQEPRLCQGDGGREGHREATDHCQQKQPRKGAWRKGRGNRQI